MCGRVEQAVTYDGGVILDIKAELVLRRHCQARLLRPPLFLQFCRAPGTSVVGQACEIGPCAKRPMEWLREKVRRAEPAGQERAGARPASSGSARDVAEVTVEGVGGSHPPDRRDEVHEWKASPEHKGGGDEHREDDVVGGEDGNERASGFVDMSRAELAGRLFDTIDKSGDGELSKEELTPALQGIGYSKEKAEGIFASIDDDASNQISKDEFVRFFEHGNDELFRKLRYAGIKTKVPKNVPVIKTGTAGPARASVTALALQEVWEQHDGDRDGWLTEQQLYAAMRSVGIRLRKKEKHELRRELEDELELWSDSNDSPTPSNASVASDIDADETVYEDHSHIVRVLQNNPRDSIERLVITEKGKPEWTAIPDGFDRLDRDKPEQVANWVAATCTPGLSLKETKDEVAAKTKFYKMVHHYQMAHESNSLASERLRFQRAWMDRSLERSPAEEKLRKWFKEIRTSAYWKGLVLTMFTRLKKKVEAELEFSQEILSRKRKSLKRSSVQIMPRNVLERITQTFVDELKELDEEDRRVKFEAAFQDICIREETETLGARGVIRVMRVLGASLNSAEVFEMVDEITGLEAIAEDVSVDVYDFCAMAENLYQAVIVAGSKDKVLVYVQEAHDVPVMDRFGSADPFVTVEVLGRSDEDRRKTATRKNSLNPAWRHQMSIFDVNPQDVVLVSMWDDEESGFGATLIGEFTTQLSDVIETGESVNSTTHVIERWFELMDDNGNFIVGKYGSATKIRARLSYVRGNLNELKQKPMGPQNLEFSLITLKIKSAQHLPKMDKGDTGSVDPYCIVSYTDHKIRTCTVLQNYSPTWDEEYILSVDEPSGEIVVTMYDYDEDGKDDAIGSCKVFVALLGNDATTQVYDLRSVEENSLIVGKDNERAALHIEASLLTNEQMNEEKSLMEIIFMGMGCDHTDTVLACCSALWQLLQNDEDRCEREALHILNQWQTMADVLLTGVLEFDIHGASDLPRMDYFGLCDPYVVVSFDGVEAQTSVKHTTLDPIWGENLRLPTLLVPPKLTAPDKPTILVQIFDWDKVGEHDLVGSVLIPYEDWLTHGHERTEWEIVGEPEKVRSLRPGEPDQTVRKPVIGNSGRISKLHMTIDFPRRKVVLDEIMSEICWAVAFAVIGHAENAESFGLTLGGVAGLVSELRKPIPDGTGGENLMAACYALGNLAASHHSNQEIIMKNGGIERLLDLATKEMPAGVQRATCLAIAAVCGDKPECISRLLQYHKKDPEAEELIQRAGGIGKLLCLLRDMRPDPAFKPKKDGAQDGWGVVAEVYEACIKAVAATSFVNTKGLWFTNMTSIFSKADTRATVREVAVAMGRPGLNIIFNLSMLPLDDKESRQQCLRRANKETLRYANLSYQALDAAYGSG